MYIYIYIFNYFIYLYMYVYRILILLFKRFYYYKFWHFLHPYVLVEGNLRVFLVNHLIWSWLIIFSFLFLFFLFYLSLYIYNIYTYIYISLQKYTDIHLFVYTEKQKTKKFWAPITKMAFWWLAHLFVYMVVNGLFELCELL